MFYKLLTGHRLIPDRFISSKYVKLSSVDTEQNGIIVRLSVFKEFDSSENLKPFNVTDYMLQNIISKGAFDLLKPVYVPDINPLNVVAHVEQSLNSIGDVIKKAEN